MSGVSLVDGVLDRERLFGYPLLVMQVLLQISARRVEGAPAVAPSGRRPHPDRARQARPPGSTVEPRCGSGLAVPVCVVGWSEPGNQAKGGEAS